jgi:UDP-N-acetyl-2-amino-2-deoxyglucuronate dehydrogenase
MKKIFPLLFCAKFINAEVEDLSVAICRFPNGSLAQITSSVVHHGEEQQLIFQGENARVSVPWKVTASKSRLNGFPEKDEELEIKLNDAYQQLKDLEYEGHAAQVEDVFSAIEGKKQVLVDGIEGRKTLELITAIYQSTSLGQTVKLPLNEHSPFYTRDGVLKNAVHFYEKKNHVKNFSEQEITWGEI